MQTKVSTLREAVRGTRSVDGDYHRIFDVELGDGDPVRRRHFIDRLVELQRATA